MVHIKTDFMLKLCPYDLSSAFEPPAALKTPSPLLTPIVSPVPLNRFTPVTERRGDG